MATARNHGAASSRQRRWLLVGLGSLAVAGALAPGCADRLFYRPATASYAEPADYGLTGVERAAFAAPGGPRLSGWWLPARTERQGAVVYCHGNSANLTLHARYVSWLPKYGFDVLLFDYRGYGASEGEPTRDGTVADTVAAIDFALARCPERTVVFGHSLGGALAVVAAAARPAVRAVIVESTFPSYRAIAREKAGPASLLVPLLVSDGQDPVDHLAQLPPRPLLVIHGTADHIVSFELGRKLFDAAAEPKQFYAAAGARHATPWLREGEGFERRIVAFFRQALAR